MCGIAGIIDLRRRMSSEALGTAAELMAACMVHRGPDDCGLWIDRDKRCALSQRRLSIIDTSSAGHQPMLDAEQNCAITFNGELYNYLELRQELETHGVQFRTRTDTEVLMAALKFWGDEAFSKLDGMYAFALYDSTTQELLLARDPFGKKPLYYFERDGVLAFASELEALAQLPQFERTLDDEAIAQYFALQYIHAPRTIYRQARKLPPGHLLRVGRNGQTRIRAHFVFTPNPQTGQNVDTLADELEVILKRSVKRRMISDVPLGAFLSGGVDSSLVVAMMTKALGNNFVETFSIGFSDTNESEHIFARQVATHLGCNHHEKMLAPDVIKMAEIIGAALDEPNADSSCLPTYLLSKFTRERVTVALSGDGGDEMFGGYGRYFSTLEEERKRNELENWQPGSAYFSSRILIFDEGCLKELLGDIPPETAHLLGDFKAGLNSETLPLIARMRQTDVQSYLPGAVLAKVDRMSMQHSLEVRCPLLSIEVARFAEKVSAPMCYADGQGKLVLKKLAARYMPLEWLTRPKMGFGLPMSVWGQSALIQALRSLTLSRHSMVQHYVPRDLIKRFIEKQERATSTYQLWALLIFEIWLRNHIKLAPRRATLFERIWARGSDAIQGVFKQSVSNLS